MKSIGLSLGLLLSALATSQASQGFRSHPEGGRLKPVSAPHADENIVPAHIAAELRAPAPLESIVPVPVANEPAPIRDEAAPESPLVMPHEDLDRAVRNGDTDAARERLGQVFDLEARHEASGPVVTVPDAVAPAPTLGRAPAGRSRHPAATVLFYGQILALTGGLAAGAVKFGDPLGVYILLSALSLIPGLMLLALRRPESDGPARVVTTKSGRLRLLSAKDAKRCAYCHADETAADPLVRCPECSTALHKDCRETNGRCTCLGCVPKTKVEAPAGSRASAALLPLGLLGGLTVGGLFAGMPAIYYVGIVAGTLALTALRWVGRRLSRARLSDGDGVDSFRETEFREATRLERESMPRIPHPDQMMGRTPFDGPWTPF